MKNKDLLKQFINAERILLKQTNSNFFTDIDLNSQNDSVNQFLQKYISLKNECNTKIESLPKQILKGQTIIVTGGSSGIGEQVAKLVQSLGADVYVFDIQAPKNNRVKFCNVDVRDEAAAKEAVAQIPKIDHLITSAGVFGFDSAMTEKQKENMVLVNINGTQNCINACFEKLQKSNGSICSVTSGLCKTIDTSCLLYCITKQEVMEFLKTKQNQGVRINALLPGPILTPLLVKDVPTLKEIAEYCDLNPEGYCGTPEHIALGVFELINSNANNEKLAIDGGESKMYKKSDNKYWTGEYKGDFSVTVAGKRYPWNLDNSYKLEQAQELNNG